MSGTLQHDSYTLHIIAPVILRLWSVEIKGAAFIQIAGVHLHGAALCGSDCHPAIKIDGRRHDKAVVVVGMLANQVDASGGAIEAATLSIKVSEAVNNIHGSCYGSAAPCLSRSAGASCSPRRLSKVIARPNNSIAAPHQRLMSMPRERS